MTITTPEEEKKEQEVKKKQTAKKKVETPKIPMGYVRVRLDSLGKLSAPFELHFRDYSLEEVMELASTDEEIDNLETMINILNNMVFEEFDCGDLTLQELMEITFTIQGSFYSPEIEKKVVIDLEGDLNDKDNYTHAFIPLSKLATTEIASEFKEPFTLKDIKIKDSEYKFRLPRIKDKVVAEAYLRDKYKKELRSFSTIYQEVASIESIRDDVLRKERMEELENSNPDEMVEFRKYIFNKGKLLMALTQGLSIVSVNGEELEYGDCDKALELIPKISGRVWREYTNVLEKYNFGLNDEVEIFLPELQEDVKRRLSFRYMDFIPNYDQEGDSGVVVSFE